MEYNDFLKSKLITNQPSGFECNDFPDMMYPYQKDLTRWACKRGKAALFCMTGTGKTIMQCAWAESVVNHTNSKVLILAPLAVSKQTVREALKFGIAVNICRTHDDVKQGINIANYEMLHHFHPDDFDGIVLDECFPPETLVDVFNIDNVLTRRYIKDIRKGDKILNAAGEDHVHSIYKRRINRAIKICINGHYVTCSENHPWFTMHGWQSAQDLRAGDYLMATSEAMRMVRGNIQSNVSECENAEVLRSILLSEMENEHTGTQGKSAYGGSGEETGGIEVQMVQEWITCGAEGIGTDIGFKSDEQSRNKGEAEIDIAEYEAQTFRAWGEWTPDDIAAAINEGCIVRQLDTGVCYITGETTSRFSDLLQSRLRQSRLEDSDRTGRSYTPEQETSGRKEGHKTGFFRVDSVEILELGHPELEKYRDENGDVYFYDIKATRHPSFSVHGCLVHNSSIIKSQTGKVRQAIIDFSRNIAYRLACTATPSPNDYMELGNHAEFLGIMSYTEMLATFFVHDGGDTAKWRLKGHAEETFWKWLSSWGVFLTRPSDLNYSDEGFDLPALNTFQHIVESEAQEGALFAFEAKGLTERRGARKESLERRVAKAVEIVNASDKPVMIWCGLNVESEMVTKLIPGSVEVTGSNSDAHKEKSMLDFADGLIPVMVSKSSICGWGMNWQVCHNTVFVGMSDSFESLFQSTKRFHRHGQTKEVNRHLIISEAEGSVLTNVQRKEREFEAMIHNMVEHTKMMNIENVRSLTNQKINYMPTMPIQFPGWLVEGGY